VNDDGVRMVTDAEKSVADIVAEVSQKASLLVREEIELAKAEVTVKAKRLGGGAAAAGGAGFFLLLALIFFFHAVAWFFADLLGTGDLSGMWIGFLIAMGILILIAAIAGLLALRFFRRGTPPTPQLAIEEAKKTRATIEEVTGS
jgi:Zn-dependent protease with chaperone function